ncbi:PHD finger protein EHD3 [Ziziphus jujuba]|uniref:PHD finger protein EHD3 n=1 Tax=Ziziphus jujuba TaxID=326968 RepID=A0A6P3ZZM2_ZIZJJ|nr:PHD finger protein EHD3 [Ziziphus jujuba]
MGVEEGTSNGDGSECSEGVRFFQSDVVNNGFEVGTGTNMGDGSSGASECIRTYKRRKHLKSTMESKLQEDGRPYAEAASQLVDQALKEQQVMVIGSNSCEQVFLHLNGSDYCSQRPYRNVVLEHLYQSLSDDEGGIQGCIRDALEFYPDIGRVMTVKEYDHHVGHRRECSSPTGCLLNGFRREDSEHAGISSNGYLDTSKCTVTETCQRAFFNTLISEDFASLCKLLLDNFQGIKDNVFDFSLINSRMKDGAYESSPMLFLSDFEQVWAKLQGIGTQMISLAKSLSEISRTSYNKQVGGSVRNTFQDGKHELHTKQSDSHPKLEQSDDCGLYKVCTCMRCGDSCDGRDRLVCDSCEDMYHVSCIEPAVKEIPHKSWYCATCTASGIKSPHENCAVCERLNTVKTIVNGVGNDSAPTNGEAHNELGENSNCSSDEWFHSSEMGKGSCVCKICGNEIEDGEKSKTCSHSVCPSRYYHVRCLTKMQLKSYGPQWYCPSCLCRTCLTDKDDEDIVLCDGCDHAYHIYCLKPPKTSIPRGKWFCRRCNVRIRSIRKAKRAYERRQKKGNGEFKAFENNEKKWVDKDSMESDKNREGIDMLITAMNL